MSTQEKTMKAILVKEPGDADQLMLGTYQMPEPSDDELFVKVKATALNRADILQRRGFYPPPKGASPILGLEMAGIVEWVGPKCSDWKPGDRVFGLLPGGGYAEYAVIPEAMAMPIPENFSFEEAAAIPEVFLTAYQTLFWLGNLQEKETVLIHAGASGVGTAAIQLARGKGATVIITAGSEQKLAACLELVA
jgi:tumor protein p53-inducible protein 3